MARDGAQRGVSSFHEVVAASSVDVDVGEAGNGGFVGCAGFLRTCGKCHARAWADGLHGVFANQNARVVDFCCRSESTARGNGKGRPGSTTPVTQYFAPQNKTGAPFPTPVP